MEWLEGESARFGLVHVDYPTQRRTVKKSGRLYARICREKSLTRPVIDSFAQEKSPPSESVLVNSQP